MKHVRRVAVVAAALAVATGLGRDAPLRTSAGAAAVAPPNVVVVMTDDQEILSMSAMPRTRAVIGGAGATFEDSVVTYSLCCPSRATFLTGQYTHNHGVWDNTPPLGGFPALDHTNTLPVWLHDVGYRTAYVGKYMNWYGVDDPRLVPPGWDEWRAMPQSTVHDYYDFELNENGSLRSYTGLGSYKTDVLTHIATDLVGRLAAGEAPFFLMVGYTAPHWGTPVEDDDPSIATPARAARHRGAFATAPVPRRASFNEADVSDKPITIRKQELLDEDDIAAIDASYRQKLESLLAVDEGVEGLIDALAQSGELDRTLVIFTSDNGFFHGEHRVPVGKLRHYEPSIRVPLLMRGPGIPAGVRVRKQVANIDLAPTIVAAAGAVARRTMDGRSLLPLAQDPRMAWRKHVLIERYPKPKEPFHFVAVRTDRWMYAEYPSTGERELYDLRRDPDELQSLHADPSYEEIQRRLARPLHKLLTCAGASCG